MVKKSLHPTYDGPYRVLSKKNKVFEIQYPNRISFVSIDRLKPAYLINCNNVLENKEQVNFENEKEVESDGRIEPTLHSEASLRKTRSGRSVIQPVRFRL